MSWIDLGNVSSHYHPLKQNQAEGGTRWNVKIQVNLTQVGDHQSHPVHITDWPERLVLGSVNGGLKCCHPVCRGRARERAGRAAVQYEVDSSAAPHAKQPSLDRIILIFEKVPTVRLGRLYLNEYFFTPVLVLAGAEEIDLSTREFAFSRVVNL